MSFFPSALRYKTYLLGCAQKSDFEASGRESDLHTYIPTYNLYLYTMKISKLTSLWGRVLIRDIKKELQLIDKNNSYKI